MISVVSSKLFEVVEVEPLEIRVFIFTRLQQVEPGLQRVLSSPCLLL